MVLMKEKERGRVCEDGVITSGGRVTWGSVLVGTWGSGNGFCASGCACRVVHVGLCMPGATRAIGRTWSPLADSSEFRGVWSGGEGGDEVDVKVGLWTWCRTRRVVHVGLWH